ncbi:GtrA family protein [Schauerella aestuarii]|uniref:GtrA family protein n=1 Tax=Schauerella aestuarii TaxID=2511204 RepID=UPI00136A0E2B|nr:GtrA family protein [Achromobacter aestuarii]MYZ43684.1 GtrA family protein [Achromobacter aestuarii]
MTSAFLSRQFVVFIVTGGTAALVNFLSRIAYNQVMGYQAAVIVAYLTGMVTAFILAKLFVFKESKQGLHRSALMFCLVNVVAIAQTWAISVSLAYYVLPAMGVTSYVREIAHAVGVVFPVFTSYLGHKHFSFR